MPTECSAKTMAFAPVEGRAVVADFDGGAITSDAGAMLLGATDRAIGLVERFAGCFTDGRTPGRVVHDVATLVGQRVFAIAMGYEDLVDHDELRFDPVLGVVLERLDAKHGRCAPLAGKCHLIDRNEIPLNLLAVERHFLDAALHVMGVSTWISSVLPLKTRSTKNPSHSEGMQGSMRRPSNSGRMPRT